MKALEQITAGRTVLEALLVAAVLTAGIAGAVGTAAAEPIDGKGDDPSPDDLYASLDGKGNDPFPPSLYESRAVGVVDGTGNDDVTVFAATYVGRGGGSGKPSF